MCLLKKLLIASLIHSVMLRRFLIINQRIFHSSRVTNQVDSKTVSHENKTFDFIKREESIQDKLRNVSGTALSKYNEIVGFSEIEEAYQKVTALQVS